MRLYGEFLNKLHKERKIATNYKEGEEWVTIACYSNIGDIGNFIP